MAKPASFPARATTPEVELGALLQPKFGPDGLIPCITVAHTIRTGTAAFWSRSRGKLWVKGEQSGHALKVVDLYVDCDQDVLLLKVENTGPGACHNGYRSCFYRKLAAGADPDGPGALKLEFTATRAFDPDGVYRK